jgi:outer membrane protein OmpA-like peptidoglycan-associated protein
MRVRGLTVALLLITATAASAQTRGSYEFNGFGRYTRFDDTLGLGDKFGGGGSLGFFVLRNLALEAEGAYTYRAIDVFSNSVTNLSLRGRLSYNIPLAGNATSVRMGVGYVRNIYRKAQSFDDDGVTGIFGLRLGLTPNIGVRLDGTADYVRNPDAGRADKYVNWGGQAGLSFVFGSSRSSHRDTETSRDKDRDKDKDQDGVPDHADRCPNTAAGLNVDPAGCAPSQLDTDRDRVNDDADRCPDTSAGQTVDTNGCSALQKDADLDGVLDSVDRCPRTPAGVQVSLEGCSDTQRDDDNDGVLNNADRCPATRAGESVDASGCRVAPVVAPVVGPQDSDRDGVMDSADQCPNTPMGDLVNPRGCPRDTDGDGVPDARDHCGSTPAGEKIDANGCPIGPSSPLDSDRDGVMDSVDQCPNTPAGDIVNPRGCTRDTDGDGVPDSRDHCGSTPVGEKIDENGCPILFKRGARSVILRGVTFQTGRAMLTPGGRDVLRDIASQLVENPEYRVQISGHTDNTGSRAANLRLSLARARTVETFLEANGVPPRQITAKGFGPDVPIAPNTTAAGRAKNRRVELNRTN